ncbi:SUMF1/EgtB/PvdO family nonheme iron enzyme [Vibrio gazogenes]|uniref:Formylglycine-generating enzyme, required for sulfatase activity, contains SUMF1/FGE domain n=1 Tax=Vibrio gazogenes DSM 21264 = NBRC 103151 TaxID=1123492 RepID=A0A1M5A0F1_VIBGA|nr:SUMF1/EgtB/PvdO family nonheme iron enzyme [Vibrio gazogenes]USP13403.1 formylglycine-generating enzyme family protein [Vibrio gazogenes]SHF23577.1 Formylglycine-generating enzyme, required for sulfatase activity, contains SUMF1/FGE domain [Vibrio gazogenes DSM 21264] [Vibrio gazogenes DSM 21264 = NBRC 103151]SJN58385.1 Formylglycine-generating sulfatase enzyme [Vibrio gazogenes]
MRYLLFLCIYSINFSVFSSTKNIPKVEESLVQAGDYYVGDVFGQQPYEKHTNVTIKSFYIMQNEVTRSLLDQVKNWAIQHSLVKGDMIKESNKEESNIAAANVSWWDAIIFSNMISRYYDLSPYYLDKSNHPIFERPEDGIVTVDDSASGYRLPSIFEWQIAARGGQEALKNQTYGTLFAGSDQRDSVGWFPTDDLSQQEMPYLVRQKKPNELNLFDMSGNVAEWTGEAFNLDDNNILYFYCGGSFIISDDSLANCDIHSRGHKRPDLGFRLVRYASQP